MKIVTFFAYGSKNLLPFLTKQPSARVVGRHGRLCLHTGRLQSFPFAHGIFLCLLLRNVVGVLASAENDEFVEQKFRDEVYCEELGSVIDNLVERKEEWTDDMYKELAFADSEMKLNL